jgi:hypothetical protein
MAGPQVFYEDGSPVPLDQVDAALRDGTAFVDQSSPLTMIDETGAPVRIKPAELDAALARGYSFDDPAAVEARKIRRERTTGVQVALSALEGGARGATLGLSDVALTTALGDEYRDGARARKQANPVVSGVAEVAGAVGGTLATGGLTGAIAAPARGAAAAGRLAEGGTLAAARALGYRGATGLGRLTARAASLGAAGATEGAFYGAGQAISRAALDGSEITAEKVLGSMGDGAFLGAAAGGSLGAGAEALKSGGRALLGASRKSRTLREGALDLRNESAIKAIGGIQSDFQKLGKTAARREARVRDIGNELFEYRFKAGEKQGEKIFQFARSPDDFVDDLVQAREETGQALGKLRDRIDSALEQRPDLAVNLRAYLDEVEEQVLKPLRESNVPAVRARANKVDEQLAIIRQRLESPVDALNEQGVLALRQTGGQMRDLSAFRKAYEGATPEMAEAIATGAAPPVGSVTGRAFDPIVVSVTPEGAILRDGHHRATAAAEAGARNIRATVKTYDDAGNLVSEGEELLSLAPRPRAPLTFRELNTLRQDLRSVFQPPKPSTGGLPPPVPEHAEHIERAERILADHIDEAAERGLRELGEDTGQHRALKQQFRNLSDAEDIATKAAARQVGNRFISPSDYGTGVAAALGALMTGNVGALGVGVAGSLAHKLIRERGRSMVAVLADRVARYEGRLDAAAQRFAGKERVPASVPRRALIPSLAELQESYSRAATVVRQFQQDPDFARARLIEASRVAPEHPQLAEAMQGQLERTYSYLATKLPRPMTRAGASLTPELEGERVPPAAMAKFLRQFRGATAPGEVIDDLRNGKLDRDGIEAIKEVHPQTFEELRNRVMLAVAKRETPLSFNERMLLSLAFDFRGDKSLEPGFAFALQSAFMPASTPSPTPDAPGPTIELSPKIADQMQTNTQRLEM